MKNWKFWFWSVVILIAVLFNWGFITLKSLLVVTYPLAAAAFYNTLVIHKELEDRESLKNAWEKRSAKKTLDLLAKILFK